MARGQEGFQATNPSGQVLLACGFTRALSTMLQAATTLLGHILSCLAGKLVQAGLWILITICRALVAHLQDYERIVVCYQCLTTLGPLVHCLLLGK